MDAVTRSWMSRDATLPRSLTLRVTTGLPMTAGGQSHSWVTATSSSWSPMAQTISVADGRRDAIRIVIAGDAGPTQPGGFSSSTDVRAAALSVYQVASIFV